jgi:hypothetical protein|tara:strand:+ start:301 stop:567 length:267 start_codon:yes stop_codon:yes gene_type:complete
MRNMNSQAEDLFKKHKRNLKKLEKDLKPIIENYISYCNWVTLEYLTSEDDKFYAVHDGFIRKELIYMVENIVREIHKDDDRRRGKHNQ